MGARNQRAIGHFTDYSAPSQYWRLVSMNNDQALKQILVGSVIALVGAIVGAFATAIINLLFAGKINVTYWWVWGIGGVLGALLLYGIYQANRFPFTKYRVTNKRDGKGLWCPDISRPED